jgi:hypothetical protein
MLINLVNKVGFINNILIDSIKISNLWEILINEMMNIIRLIYRILNIRVIYESVEVSWVHSVEMESSTFLKYSRNIQ